MNQVNVMKKMNQVIGYNSNGRISSSLSQTVIKQFSEFSMKDGDSQPLVPVLAICGNYYTLFMFSKKSGNGNQLDFCDCDINEGSPVFLDIGDKQPLSLFGGCSHSAAISTEGEVIFINRYSVRNSPSARIESSSLPNGEKATGVACGYERVIALSSSGVVFSSKVEYASSVLKFSRVEELSYRYNYHGELLLMSGPSDDICSPKETTITNGATFCIAGNEHSVVFIGGNPPPNTPNMPINFNKQ